MDMSMLYLLINLYIEKARVHSTHDLNRRKAII